MEEYRENEQRKRLKDEFGRIGKKRVNQRIRKDTREQLSEENVEL